MSPADVATGFLNAIGSLIWLMFGVMGVGAVWLVLKHRRVHARLGLPSTGYYATCPMCTDERERRELPWAVRYSRDLKRKRYKREEISSGRR